MNQIIEDAKAELLRAKDRISKGLKNTPDDKINWSPSPTARTPVELVAHAAMGTRGLGALIAGKPFPYANMAEMDRALREHEKEFTSREQAFALLDETTKEYISWMESLSEETLSSKVKFPMGDIPMTIAMTIPADHMRSHAAQLEYVQTVYGDREVRM